MNTWAVIVKNILLPHLFIIFHSFKKISKCLCSSCCFFIIIFVFKKYLFILIGGLLFYSIVVAFAIHWHESAMGVHVSAHPVSHPPTPTSKGLSRVFSSTQFESILLLWGTSVFVLTAVNWWRSWILWWVISCIQSYWFKY